MDKYRVFFHTSNCKSVSSPYSYRAGTISKLKCGVVQVTRTILNSLVGETQRINTVLHGSYLNSAGLLLYTKINALQWEDAKTGKCLEAIASCAAHKKLGPIFMMQANYID